MKFLAYRLVRLTTEAEFLKYNHLYMQNGGDQSIPLSWMRSSKVFAVFRQEQMLGGYVECSPPIRSVADIPENIRIALLKEKCGSLDRVQENAAFWIKRSTKGKTSLQAFVWATVVLRSVFCTKCKFTLGVSNRSSITKLYGFFCGKVIFKSPSKLIAGEDYVVFLWSKTQLLTVGLRIFYRLARKVILKNSLLTKAIAASHRKI